MPFARPTLTELRGQAAADINAAVPGADALLRFSNLNILGDVLAGFSHLHFGYLDWIAKQAVPFTADEEYLAAWAALKGVIAKGGVLATGAVRFQASDAAVLPIGTSVLRSDGAQYVTTAAATAAGGYVVAPAIAVARGSVGNAPVGTTVSLSASLTGISRAGTLSSAMVGGLDAETSEELRSRMLQAYAAGGQGGSLADFVTWALQLSGVTRAWARRGLMGPGTITVYPMLDALRTNGFPTGVAGVAVSEPRDMPATGDLLAVANYLLDRQPANALVYVAALTPQAVNLTLVGMPEAQRATSTATIDAALLAVEPGGVVRLLDIGAALAEATGVRTFRITAPSADIAVGASSLPVRGTLTLT